MIYLFVLSDNKNKSIELQKSDDYRSETCDVACHCYLKDYQNNNLHFIKIYNLFQNLRDKFIFLLVSEIFLKVTRKLLCRHCSNK